MLAWNWFFAWLVVYIFINGFVLEIYMHRGLAHNYFVSSALFGHICRFALWLRGSNNYRWMELYQYNHLRHHRLSDSIEDTQSPFHLTFRNMFQRQAIDYAEFDKFSPINRTPTDWVQTHVYNAYPQKGPWITHALNFCMFGIVGFVLSIIVVTFINRYFFIYIGNYIVHKVGFTYAGNHGSDRSKIMFPIGIILFGEELHANHHNDPSTINYAQRWFEYDFGYTLIKVLDKLKLITITKK